MSANSASGIKCDAQRINIVLNIVVIVGLSVCIILSGVTANNSYKTSRLLASTLQLSQELRQSSDDLTRFVRTYTVTGNHSYWDYFQQVIKIRNGEAPLPVSPWRNYWDLFITNGRAPRDFQPASSLLSRIEGANFLPDEIELLNEAKRQSDALIDMEDVAYNAMQGQYRPSVTTGLTKAEALAFSVRAAPNQTFAQLLVHGIPYHQWKGRIMQPLDDFAGKSFQRASDNVDFNFSVQIGVIIGLAMMMVVLIVLLLVYFCKIKNEAQAQQLLSTVLPARIVDSITVSHFSELKRFAAKHARRLRGSEASVSPTFTPRNMNEAELRTIQSNTNTQNVVVPATLFPVLYSEFLPVAWVAFTDVVGFTVMCRTTPARAVIAILNEMFSLLDVEALRFGVEKIKTIGDAFMCAKLSTSELTAIEEGETKIVVEERKTVDAQKISRDGVEIILFLLRAIAIAQRVKRPIPKETDETWAEEPHKPNLELRVGLHAGPVASGIVGFERPLYDLFGDTVNTAARLESSGIANQIQVMASCVETYLDPKAQQSVEFGMDYHVVQLKGIGEATTRFITGCDAQMSFAVQDEMTARSSSYADTQRA
jgi:adenylate cyclase